VGEVVPLPPAKEDRPPPTPAPGKPKPMPKPKPKPPRKSADNDYLDVAEEDGALPPTPAHDKVQTLPKPPRKSADNDYGLDYLQMSSRQSSPN